MATNHALALGAVVAGGEGLEQVKGEVLVGLLLVPGMPVTSVTSAATIILLLLRQ